MPYGMPGGDTPESDSWMERCVTHVMAEKGHKKGEAIAICKSTYDEIHRQKKPKKKGKKS